MKIIFAVFPDSADISPAVTNASISVIIGANQITGGYVFMATTIPDAVPIPSLPLVPHTHPIPALTVKTPVTNSGPAAKTGTGSLTAHIHAVPVETAASIANSTGPAIPT